MDVPLQHTFTLPICLRFRMLQRKPEMLTTFFSRMLRGLNILQFSHSIFILFSCLIATAHRYPAGKRIIRVVAVTNISTSPAVCNISNSGTVLYVMSGNPHMGGTTNGGRRRFPVWRGRRNSGFIDNTLHLPRLFAYTLAETGVAPHLVRWFGQNVIKWFIRTL